MKHLSRGQLAFEVLHAASPELAAELSGTEFDPFHDDSRIEAFIREIRKRAKEEKR